MKNSLAKTIRTAAAAMGAVMALSCAPAAFAEDAHDLSSLTAGEFTVMMGNGINLGNTMEAYRHVLVRDRLGTAADHRADVRRLQGRRL